MSELAKRLRNAAACAPTFGPLLTEAAEAADENERLKKEVAELRAATGEQWISVADRLPADGELCWVHGANFESPFPAVRRRVAAGGWHSGWHDEDTWEDWDGEVGRWFPLPKPPAVEGES